MNGSSVCAGAGGSSTTDGTVMRDGSESVNGLRCFFSSIGSGYGSANGSESCVGALARSPQPLLMAEIGGSTVTSLKGCSCCC